ncbi:DUF4179 domain-containing protein [Clostridium sp. 'White wine YQ']|uniref:DUF4179 domain-containing protein n=1 Tax=Clostridium sp. 'White wine YQ' TaxID=3027474 RepID=UPI0023672604|nr:DUF4179 domain-containing protein [Clostridium sp. 'White wine YQ']MDD7795303.1 DUF4179 domain-containing protein [Clostridium sp. 'White wine YQ']
MINENFNNIQVPDGIDSTIENAVLKAVNDKKLRKPKKIKIASIAVSASFAVLFTLGYSNPAFAAKLPIVGSVFESIEKNIYFPGNYSEYSTSVNKSAVSNGIKITMSDILCDGQSLYVTYKIESPTKFKYTSWGDKPLTMNQLMTSEAYKKVSFSNKELDDSGFAGLEGKFLDENTFIGMEKYNLDSLGTDIPDNFDFQVKLTTVGTHGLNMNDKDQYFDGTWAFKVPVKVDKSLIKNITISDAEANGQKIQSISTTPFQLMIKTSHPKNDAGTFNDIRVYDDKGNEFRPDSGRIEDGIETSLFAAPSKDTKSIRIIIYKGTLKEASSNNPKNLKDLILLDKTVPLN